MNKASGQIHQGAVDAGIAGAACASPGMAVAEAADAGAASCEANAALDANRAVAIIKIRSMTLEYRSGIS
jgi:hypothetical protein